MAAFKLIQLLWQEIVSVSLFHKINYHSIPVLVIITFIIVISIVSCFIENTKFAEEGLPSLSSSFFLVTSMTHGEHTDTWRHRGKQLVSRYTWSTRCYDTKGTHNDLSHTGNTKIILSYLYFIILWYFSPFPLLPPAMCVWQWFLISILLLLSLVIAHDNV